jgi:oxalate decarboxylase
MFEANRRIFLQSFAVGPGSLAASQSFAGGSDGHAAGYDVSAAQQYLKTIPGKTGDPVIFAASLGKGAVKATSAGWAREVTMRVLPIARDIAGAHLFLNAGGAREMHWHNSAEWAYVIDGHCQITVVDPEGAPEIANLGPGDLWYVPKGHSHAIQTLGPTPCHAILAFDDGLYSEHGTFGISDWMSQYDTRILSQALGVPAEAFARPPKAETYIIQGEVLPLDGPAGTRRARTGSGTNASLSPDGAEAARQHTGRPALRCLFKGISDVDDDDDDRDASQAQARRNSRTLLACGRQRVALCAERANPAHAVRAR